MTRSCSATNINIIRNTSYTHNRIRFKKIYIYIHFFYYMFDQIVFKVFFKSKYSHIICFTLKFVFYQMV